MGSREMNDEEIRIRCAEAMGISVCDDPAYSVEEGDIIETPDYLASVDAALTLCERLREENCNVKIEGHGYYDIWFVTISRPSEEFKVADPSLARAICLAFLKTQQPTGQETR